jgi:transposase-like protein
MKNSEIYCPKCGSSKVINNGKPQKRKRQWKCKDCGRYFLEDVLKGYPSTKYPFPIIALVLYHYRYSLDKSDIKKFKNFTNHLLHRIGFIKENVSRHTIYYWIKTYEPKLDTYNISLEEARKFIRKNDITFKKPKNYERVLKTLPRGSHLEGLKDFCIGYGEEHVLEMIRSNNDAVNEVCRSFGWNKTPKKAIPK